MPTQLGWTPVRTSDTAPFTDSRGNTYDQVATAGSPVPANAVASGAGANGLNEPRTLISAAGRAGSAPSFTGGLGIAEGDARLKLLIPITAQTGVYEATLTITAL